MEREFSSEKGQLFRIDFNGRGFCRLIRWMAVEIGATGLDALFINTTGRDNTANGYEALFKNTTGNYNTANGYYALYSNTTGISNTANGFDALYSNTLRLAFLLLPLALAWCRLIGYSARCIRFYEARRPIGEIASRRLTFSDRSIRVEPALVVWRVRVHNC